MNESGKAIAIEKILNMPPEEVLKLLIFMAGMEAEKAVDAGETQFSLFAQN